MLKRVTYYMVECDYPHKTDAQRIAFDEFYWGHVSMLLTIPGFLSAQRFHCDQPVKAPFLALYKLAGPEVMTSCQYTSKAGRMSVDPNFRSNMTNWDRNLVQGPEGMPELDLATEMESVLTLIDRCNIDAPPLPVGFTPLTVVGLDRTIAERGVTVGATKFAKTHPDWEVRRWQPIHHVRTPTT